MQFSMRGHVYLASPSSSPLYFFFITHATRGLLFWCDIGIRYKFHPLSATERKTWVQLSVWFEEGLREWRGVNPPTARVWATAPGRPVDEGHEEGLHEWRGVNSPTACMWATAPGRPVDEGHGTRPKIMMVKRLDW